MDEYMQIAKQTLFIGYYDIRDLRSAPQVRIYEMAQAFRNDGTRHFIIGDRFARIWKQLWAIGQISKWNIKYVYLENSTSTAWPMDLLFLKYLHFSGVKIGIFIRDIYPHFSNYRSELHFYQKPLYWGWHYSMNIYLQTADIIFTPTKKFLKFFQPSPKRWAALPPGINPSRKNLLDSSSNYYLYLGNINRHYGLDLFKRCLEHLALNAPEMTIFVISKSETAVQLREYGNCSVSNVPYNKIPELNEKFLAGIIASHGEYQDVGINLKLIDYLSLSLPVALTYSESNAQIIEKERAGFVAEPPESLPKLLAQLPKRRM